MDDLIQPLKRPAVLKEPDGQARLFPASESTHRNYEAQWKRFTEWAEFRGVSVRMPVKPEIVSGYLWDRYRGNLPPAWNRPATSTMKPSTLRVVVAAIAYMHEWRDLPNPCESRKVTQAVDRIVRDYQGEQDHATRLDGPAFDRIRKTATEPRIGRSGKLEQRGTALKRGRFDVALIGVMRDAMLLVDEAADLKWEDIERRQDGSGVITFRRPHVRRDDDHATLTLEIMEDLSEIRRYAGESGSVFGMSPHQISSRIERAARQAGLEGRFNGRSPRMGKAKDLAEAGQ